MNLTAIIRLKEKIAISSEFTPRERDFMLESINHVVEFAGKTAMSVHLEKLVREWRDAQKAIDRQVEEAKTQPVLQAARGFAVQRLIDAHNALLKYADEDMG